MKQLILPTLAAGQLLLAGCISTQTDHPYPMVNKEHVHMTTLLDNAMSYINPEHKLIDQISGYPVEGWNHDPARGLYLRSFTQLTSIGEWVELLANIAAGYADNPYISRTDALDRLDKATATLLTDQADPSVSAKGLLGNFLGLENDRRLGPLTEDVKKSAFIQAFGAEKADQIWQALIARKWIEPVRRGTDGKINRVGEYGGMYFTGNLEPYADEDTREQIMAILDARVVKIIFGDNVNLTSSIAKAIGALMHPSLQGNQQATQLIEHLEGFIVAQKEGYDHLYDPKTETFIFGWDATNDRFVGWDDGKGNWIVGHQNYFINEFRAPFMFCLLKYDFPINTVKNSGFKIKPYRTANGKDIYTLATWHGSSFQSLGLTTFMQELDYPGWQQNLENTVDIEIDFANRHGNPGFLTESYSGNGVEYTGDVGISDIAVASDHRITDAPSLYTLGVAYAVAPQKVEHFLAQHWQIITELFTDHGPWEGYKTSEKRVIEFQTSAHTMSLILGGIGSGNANMKRYLGAHELVGKLDRFNQPGKARNLMASDVQWAASGKAFTLKHGGGTMHIRGEQGEDDSITITLPEKKGISLSNGTLNIRYRTEKPITQGHITLKRSPEIDMPPMDFENEIYLRFYASGSDEQEIEIPMPGTPGLHDVQKLALTFENEQLVNLSITGFEFIPTQQPDE